MPKCGCSGTTCGCSITAGTGTTVTGTGTAADPFKVNVNPATLGLSTAIAVSNTNTVVMTKSGSFAVGDPLILTAKVAVQSPDGTRYTPVAANGGTITWVAA